MDDILKKHYNVDYFIKIININLDYYEKLGYDNLDNYDKLYFRKPINNNSIINISFGISIRISYSI